MPSSPSYVRDYKQERKTARKRGELADNASRKRARRIMAKKGLVKPFDGKEVDHTTALSKGGGVTADNLRVKSKSDNRSFPRNPDGSMKKNT